MTDGELAAARDVAEAMSRGGENELKGLIMRRLCDEVERCHQALRECQATIVATIGALPNWCGEGTLAERVASVVRQREEAVAQARDAERRS